ncbi:YEATS domain-containing protein 4 [Neopelma chrysocephalum]|uniref:YEATS domain-containing protein 4 n=1 Tax=Neopelma chrysocephalum TaxID=114329 RepID=UPI000FCD1E38|nr:YEATS domain-containing protein 4 [Neopelma chrysocephalum]
MDEFIMEVFKHRSANQDARPLRYDLKWCRRMRKLLRIEGPRARGELEGEIVLESRLQQIIVLACSSLQCLAMWKLNHGSYRPTAAGGTVVAGGQAHVQYPLLRGSEALEQVAQRSFGCPISGSVQGQTGWGFEPPGLGVTIVKPIVYGNVARYFGKKREEDGHTHQWTVYVKPYRNEDMSAYVKKIQFKLHESYGNPLRVVTKPPYEITETGWGEFEIIIKIFFIDPNERPVTLYHLLKLFQSDTNAILGKKTVVSEFYDEMIFQDPTAMMQQLLTTSRQLTLGAYKHETEFADLEVKTREKLEAAKKKTSFEIAELKERLKASRETINCLKNEIRKLEEDDQSKDM